MKKLIAFCLIVWISLCAYYYVCRIMDHDCSLCTLGIACASDVPAPDGIITLDEFQTQYPPHTLYSFIGSDSLVIEDSAQQSLDQLSLYLNSSYQHILISGYFSPEEGETMQEDLGNARAERIAEYLHQKGVDTSLITISSHSYSDLQIENVKVLSPIHIGKTYADSTLSDEEVSQYLNEKPSENIYFNSTTQIPILNPQEDFYIEAARRYLSIHPESHIFCVGHTDNENWESRNEALGMKYADKISQVLQSRGISKNQIITQSRGSYEPIADNSTADGRARNNRVELKITH